MGVLREHPYVWVTWMSRLMAGEVQCEWSTWFRSHYQYDRRPSDFNLAKWTADHAEMVREQATGLRAKGYHVMLEGQNAFKMLGRNEVTLAGKPDIVAERDGTVHVIECKTGSPRVSDHMQVLIYMLVLPYVRPIWKLAPLHGRLQYRYDQAELPPEAIDEPFRTRFRQLMAEVGGVTPLLRVPSYAECQFCDITRRDCPDRVDTPPPDVMASEHDLF